MAKKIKAAKPITPTSGGGMNSQMMILFGVIGVAILGLVVFIFISQESAGEAKTLDENETYAGVPLAGEFSTVRTVERTSDVAENVTQGIIDSELPNLDGLPYIGDLNAPIYIGELADFTCPSCMNYHSTMEQLVMDFARTGDAAIFYMPYPLPSHEPEASYSARAAMCAAQQGGFWEMHDEIFRVHRAESAGELVPSRLEQMASNIGLDGSQMRECMNTNAADQALVNAQRLWNSVGATGTPTLIYSVDGGNTWRPIAQGDGGISGGVPYDTIASLIRSANEGVGG